MACDPPPFDEQPGLSFDLKQTASIVDPPEGTDPDDYEHFYGPFTDPFTGPLDLGIGGTIGLNITLAIFGPIPLRITWTHHEVSYSAETEGLVDETSEEEIILSGGGSNTWPPGAEHAGEEIADYTASWDDNFVAHRAV